MASGRLGANTSSGSGTITLYTTPVGKTTEASITVYNGGSGQAKVTLFRSPTGSPLATHTIQLEVLDVNASFERTAVILAEGENICYKTDVAGVTAVVNGVEYSSLTNEVLQQELITTNTETVIYSNAGAKAGTINISVSLVDGSLVGDTATCSIYTSTTNAAGGYPMHKLTLINNGTSGFEKTGFPISTTDKVIMITTGIIGRVATTVSGYSK